MIVILTISDLYEHVCFQHLWHLISVIQRNSSSVNLQEFASLDHGTAMVQLTVMIIQMSLHLVEL